MSFLEELSSRRRFGMRPGLGTISGVCAALGNPERRFSAIHVAGTNGKGAVCAMLDAALRREGFRLGRYTSPHLVRINERFFLDGAPVADADLERAAFAVDAALRRAGGGLEREITFFEALTAVAFRLYADAAVDYAILECGLGGRLDATNVCTPALTVITRIGLDHCDWLGDTVEKIAAEKAGIVKPGVPVVLGRNEPSVRKVVEARAAELGAPFYYAPELVDEGEIPPDLSLKGSFNRENAVTALAALRLLAPQADPSAISSVVWPGRFQRIGKVLVDGAHNPPAARALAESLAEFGVRRHSLALVCGFCGDKDAGAVLSALAPFVSRGYAVRTNNPRSLSAEETSVRMRAAGIEAAPCASLREALSASGVDLSHPTAAAAVRPSVLVCGSLFLAGEALVELGAYPWPNPRFDPSETLKVDRRAVCYVGCYPGARVPEALHVLECDIETGELRDVQTVTGVEGTAYLQIDRDGRWLYSVLGDERKSEEKGRIVRFALEGGKIGKMEVLAELPCPAPCHVGLSPDGRDIAFAAYRAATAGCVAATVRADVRSAVLANDGIGPNRKRQTKAFAHFVFFTPDGRRMGVINLGCDRIHFFDPQTMVEDKAMLLLADPGDGPRHAVWSPDSRFLFVVNELGSSVTSYAWGQAPDSTPDFRGQAPGAAFRKVGKWSTLPPDFNRWEEDGETLATKASAIKLTADGEFLLASNRGHDSIAVFSVNAADGTLELRGISPLAGRSPRDFELMPGDRFAVVGYELDDGIQSYRFDREKGSLTPVSKPIPAWHPVCFKFVTS